MMTSTKYDLFHNNINKKIKVLEVINSLNIGGAELLLRNFVIEAKKNNQYTVDVCTLYASNDVKNIEEIKKKNVRIWSLDLKNIKMLHNSGWQVLLVKNFYFIGLLIRAIFAIFRKDRRVSDYLKLFKKILAKGE